jgi:G:T-mismatch repair DNA endonuclease (very short patch repair protein)
MMTSALHFGNSMVACEMFSHIDESHPSILYGNNEKEIKVDKNVYWLDCVDTSTKRVIEFYGDYWHANPTKYNDDFMFVKNKIPTTALQIRNKDAKRIQQITDKGYSVMVVWEKDYRLDKLAVIQKCIEFLNGEV